MSTLLPAADIAQAHAAIKAAMTYINDTREPGDRRSLDLWNDLNSARAFVKCYLLDKVPAVEVEVTSEVDESCANEAARLAYRVADAMLRERAR